MDQINNMKVLSQLCLWTRN